MNDQDVTKILALEAALSELEATHPRQARMVELRFFVGLSIKEIADVLGVAERTAKLDWQLARLKLRDAIDEDAERE